MEDKSSVLRELFLMSPTESSVDNKYFSLMIRFQGNEKIQAQIKTAYKNRKSELKIWEQYRRERENSF